MTQQRRPGFPARMDWHPPGAAVGPGTARAQRGAAPTPPQGLGLDSAAVRARMVQRLAAGGIAAQPVLQALGTVERHCFVDTALVNQAYEDTSLPIGLAQTISKPSVVARMTELLLGAECARGQALGRVLEIGTGCGYQAAVLAHLAREVYTVERLRALHEKAREHLRPLRLANVHLILGDGMLGYPAGAPYAGIIAAAGGDSLPQAWCEQLAVGGRLVAPMAAGDGRQVLLVVDRTIQGFRQSVLESVNFVPLKSGIA
ncbi:protein-L-isoaspartate(D-aspartate) O-methyltransferase [Melaminivora sp.]|uniref:protein-L-isoaspartate(D-aspartate) O-methyltransferase n=1 Tax=Melaminivora sp. TaxID=1933032 RepID=UPI0028B0E0D0|nr:protein-L-isoaspartate(D-aspartate) O-methyltransferase [Melaminivora sp.]